MDQIFTVQFWHDNGPYIASAWPLFLLASAIGVVVTRFVDSGEIRGLKSSKVFLKEQLELATKKQNTHTQEIGALAPEIEQLKVEVSELRRTQTELKDAHTPQLERLSATTAAIEQRLAAVSQSNTTLGQVLQLEARGSAVSGGSALARLKRLQDEH